MLVEVRARVVAEIIEHEPWRLERAVAIAERDIYAGIVETDVSARPSPVMSTTKRGAIGNR